MSYALVSITDRLGYLGAYGMWAGVMTAIGLMAMALYIFGKRLRLWSMQFIKDDVDGKPHIG